MDDEEASNGVTNERIPEIMSCRTNKWASAIHGNIVPEKSEAVAVEFEEYAIIAAGPFTSDDAVSTAAHKKYATESRNEWSTGVKRLLRMLLFQRCPTPHLERA